MAQGTDESPTWNRTFTEAQLVADLDEILAAVSKGETIGITVGDDVSAIMIAPTPGGRTAR